jgi:hypothetical protein
MNDHRFKVGQSVEYYPPRSFYAPRGAYHVTAERPFRAGEFEYRIKHPREQYERVAAERSQRSLELMITWGASLTGRIITRSKSPSHRGGGLQLRPGWGRHL